MFTDTKKPSLEVLKYDPVNEKYLGGATFRIAKIEDGSLYLDRITDENGRIRIDDLEPGIYSVQEAAAPSGYVLNNREYHVELFPGKTSQLVVINETKPSLIVWKYDGQTAKPLPDAEFSISKKGGSIIYEGLTGSEGYIRLDNLDEGWYTVTEIGPPPGYLPSEPASKDVYLYAGATVEVKFDNLKSPTLTINKVDSITGDPIKGAKFSVIYASNNTFTGEINDLGVYYSDENGQIFIETLQDGWYKITELEPAAGYMIKDPATQTIFVKAGENKSVTFENVPKSAIVVRKVDALTGDPIPETLIRICYLSGTSGTDGTVVFESRTSVNGTVVATNLKAGTYIVEEVTPNPDYVMTGETSKTVYLSGDEQAVVTVELTNNKKGQLLIQKLDSATNKPLAGAVFLVTDSSGSVIGPNNGRYTSGKDGLVIVDESLAPGTTVVVKEVKCPDGYVLDGTPQSIKIKADETHTLTFYNAPIGGLKLIKLDATDRTTPIEGAEFTIRKANGEYIGTYTTDKSGIILAALEDGWYEAVETYVKKPYKLDQTPHKFEVKNGKSTELKVYNRQMSGLLIHKTDSVTGKGIYGVTFILYDSGMNPIKQLVTDQSGYAWVDGELSAGKYFVREQEPAAGYEADKQTKTVYVEEGTTTTIEWTNKPVMAQIQVIKYAFDDNSLTGAKAGILLPGAVFEISKHRSGEVVGYITTDATGVAASEPLPLGRYIVREVTPAPFYVLSQEKHDIDLEYSGQIVKISAYNKSVSLGTTISKKGNMEVVAGDSMRYDIYNIANTSNVPLSDFYWSDRIPVDAARVKSITTGTYSQRLYYRVLFKTNYNDYRVLAANLLSTSSYSFNLTASALGLMSGEVVTEIRLEFGTVEAGFHSVKSPTITVDTLSSLPSGYQFTNKCEVGGQYKGAWEGRQAKWITKVVKYNQSDLPKTGY